jgi:NosR/NirI family nitrous oxide reductase transcriptional regulator
METIPNSGSNTHTASKSGRFDVLFAIGVVAVLTAAWLVGLRQAESDIEPFLKQVFPTADRFTPSSGSTSTVWENDSVNPAGYIGIGTADGYGGELKIVVAVSTDGKILSSTVYSHRETGSYFQRAQEKDLLSRFVGKSGADAFAVNGDVDGITGATATSRALADASRRAVRTVSEKVLSLPVPSEPSPEVQFGWPEVVLILFILSGLILQRRGFRWKRAFRYATLVAGLAVIGFLLNRPLNLVFINKLILGTWPALETNLYWYILLAGFLLFILAGGTNAYCDGICPFGAAQEFLGMFGGGRTPSHRLNAVLKWLQRGLALVLLVLALIYRNPSANNYEVSGTLFGLIGTSFHFGLLGAVIIASLFIRRFWCRGICPVRPVADSLLWLRRKVRRSSRVFRSG